MLHRSHVPALGKSHLAHPLLANQQKQQIYQPGLRRLRQPAVPFGVVAWAIRNFKRFFLKSSSRSPPLFASAMSMSSRCPKPGGNSLDFEMT
ncbi:hypothetical protein L596_028155 [Steinernema carpocapsae]|uniref:Uncharacterized protein n=1 Tax=Steinernema carpocapsae TaxID=34508 RepID=A0A4U5LXN0_STECR|nr:hypothetical protein L596_028155 [Steinernema carpocapsae]